MPNLAAPLIGLVPISVTPLIALTPVMAARLIMLALVLVTPPIALVPVLTAQLVGLVLNLTALPIKSSTYFGVASCVGLVPDIQ